MSNKINFDERARKAATTWQNDESRSLVDLMRQSYEWGATDERENAARMCNQVGTLLHRSGQFLESGRFANTADRIRSGERVAPAPVTEQAEAAKAKDDIRRCEYHAGRNENANCYGGCPEWDSPPVPFEPAVQPDTDNPYNGPTVCQVCGADEAHMSAETCWQDTDHTPIPTEIIAAPSQPTEGELNGDAIKKVLEGVNNYLAEPQPDNRVYLVRADLIAVACALRIALSEHCNLTRKIANQAKELRGLNAARERMAHEMTVRLESAVETETQLSEARAKLKNAKAEIDRLAEVGYALSEQLSKVARDAASKFPVPF